MDRSPVLEFTLLRVLWWVPRVVTFLHRNREDSVTIIHSTRMLVCPKTWTWVKTATPGLGCGSVGGELN